MPHLFLPSSVPYFITRFHLRVSLHQSLAQESSFYVLLLGNLTSDSCLFFLILTRGHAYRFSERGEGGDRVGGRNIDVRMSERNTDWLPLARAPTKDWTCNPGMCLDWESNQWPFWFTDDAPTNLAILVRADNCLFNIKRSTIFSFLFVFLRNWPNNINWYNRFYIN